MPLLRLILTAFVVLAWLVLLIANVTAAGRTVGSMQVREGISEGQAQHRTTMLVLAWSVVVTVLAVVALVVIW